MRPLSVRKLDIILKTKIKIIDHAPSHWVRMIFERFCSQVITTVYTT